MRDHTSLESWRGAREVVPRCFRLARAHWHPAAAATFHQLQRASLSIQLNIAEGYAHGSRRSFGRHLRIAYGSAVESCEILQLLVDAEIVPGDEGTAVLEQNRRRARLLLGLLKKATAP